MVWMEELAAVVVAAGMSSRMGAFKPLLPLDGSSMIRKVICAFADIGAKRIVVVTGHRAEELEAHVAPYGVICVRNERYETSDMFTSVKLGLREVRGPSRRVFFSPGDVPLYTQDSLRAMLRKMDAGGHGIILPCYGGRPGHPILLKSECIPHILAYEGGRGLAGALEAHGGALRLALGDEGVLLDADTPDDYERLKRLAASR